MSWLLIQFIRAYQAVLGPHLGGRCRFTPSCSEYAIEAFNKKGFVKGLALSLKRVVKCGPWHPGGYDPVDKETNEAISATK
ncbi:MAG: membrane protein insertion efficiency factor YidD [Calditrichaeota bacterium]|nr:membrane protein insertion efficiency factor YidD [Calditrichota bacterium]MCB9369310.1 membrane protein insertion efficiency factor YidD [Calditrichota bacterium]